MRLLPRLILAVSVPLLILTAAVGLIVGSLSRVTDAMAELRLGELTAMQNEADLHRAGWTLDVAIRHGQVACVADPAASPRVGASIDRAARGLERSVHRYPNAHASLRQTSRAYLDLATPLSGDAACAGVTSSEVQRQRSLLDEELTNVWVARMEGLHDDVIAREEETQRLMTATLFGALSLTGLALSIAFMVSLALARSVTVPLATLTDTARRLGDGDFDTPVPPVSGPAEMVAFGRELDGMRGRLAELDSLKQGFIASCSHELRTPLSKVREALALLADGVVGTLSARQLQVVGIARAACERQIRTVSSILDLSRLRAGTPLRLRAGVVCDEVILRSVELERDEADARGVRLATELEGRASPSADLDDELLEHAVANLIRNAVSVSKSGQEVAVRRTRERRDGVDCVVIEVNDDGPGVPEELERAIFRPFVTHVPSNSPKRVGVGLGLALAREVAEAHGGELTLARRERGSSFRMIIPLERADAPTSSPLLSMEVA